MDILRFDMLYFY